MKRLLIPLAFVLPLAGCGSDVDELRQCLGACNSRHAHQPYQQTKYLHDLHARHHLSSPDFEP